jgi:hypothetical protein
MALSAATPATILPLIYHCFAAFLVHHHRALLLPATPLQVIPIDESGQLQEAFNLRLEELAVLDIQFLAGCARPTIAVLYEDSKAYARHIKTYEVSLKDKVRGRGGGLGAPECIWWWCVRV